MNVVLNGMRRTIYADRMTSRSCARQVTAARPEVNSKRIVMYSSMSRTAMTAAVTALFCASRPMVALTCSTLSVSSSVRLYFSCIALTTAVCCPLSSSVHLMSTDSLFSPVFCTVDGATPQASSTSCGISSPDISLVTSVCRLKVMLVPPTKSTSILNRFRPNGRVTSPIRPGAIKIKEIIAKIGNFLTIENRFFSMITPLLSYAP